MTCMRIDTLAICYQINKIPGLSPFFSLSPSVQLTPYESLFVLRINGIKKPVCWTLVCGMLSWMQLLEVSSVISTPWPHPWYLLTYEIPLRRSISIWTFRNTHNHPGGPQECSGFKSRGLLRLWHVGHISFHGTIEEKLNHFLQHSFSSSDDEVCF